MASETLDLERIRDEWNKAAGDMPMAMWAYEYGSALLDALEAADDLAKLVPRTIGPGQHRGCPGDSCGWCKPLRDALAAYQQARGGGE